MSLLNRAIEIYRDQGLYSLLKQTLSFFERKFRIVAYIFSVVVARVFGRREDIWIFGNFETDQQFSENSKYLYLYMNEHTDSTIKPIWITRSPDVHQVLSDAGLNVCFRGSLKARFLTLRAGVVVLSSGFEAVPFAYTGGAKTIQLGHAIPLKGPRQQVESDSTDSRISRLFDWIAERIEHIVYSVEYVCTSSDQCTDQFKRYLAMSDNNGFLERAVRSGEPLCTGFPKTDIFYRSIEGFDIGRTPADEAAADQLDQDQTTIGYFPTFRGYNSEIAPFDSDKFNTFLNEHNAQLAIKPHRHMSVDYDMTAEDNVVMIPPGMDSYPILNDIDILITDYSSVYFDFLHLDRPVVFYTFDHTKFVNHRDLMLNYEELIAGPQVLDFDSLLETLERTLETDTYATERAEIRDEMYDHQDGRACERLRSELSGLDET